VALQLAWFAGIVRAVAGVIAGEGGDGCPTIRDDEL